MGQKRENADRTGADLKIQLEVSAHPVCIPLLFVLLSCNVLFFVHIYIYTCFDMYDGKLATLFTGTQKHIQRKEMTIRNMSRSFYKAALA